MKLKQVNWLDQAIQRKEVFLKDTMEFLTIPSVLDPSSQKEGQPFGEPIAKALDYVVRQCEAMGMKVEHFDGYASHAEIGEGDELVGILCHVDVVPAGEGWTTPAFQPEIRDGKLYARGALDDKGPTMAALYAVKMIQELGLPLGKRVRLIFGTDEESGFRCMKHYFQVAEMPTVGFAPDADFPIIHAEKGSSNFTLTRDLAEVHVEDGGHATLVRFYAGERINVVPGEAEAELQGGEGVLIHLEREFGKYCQKHGRPGEAKRGDGQLHLRMKGKAAHAMDPSKGINAGLVLAHFLDEQVLDVEGARFAELLVDQLYEDPQGTKLGIKVEDDISGPLTVNVGILRYDLGQEARVHINARYPVTHTFEPIHEQILAAAQRYRYTVKEARNSKPHHVEKDDPLIRTLQRVYEEQTGEEATLLAIGGGTYARMLTKGVAFGALFPGRADCAHQYDEHMQVDDLIRAMAIYAQAVYELAK
jgi:succinyl-diaminopimelate desuccinylase